MTERISIITDEISRDLAECEEFLRAHHNGSTCVWSEKTLTLEYYTCGKNSTRLFCKKY